MRRLLPSPILSATLFVLWLLLAQSLDASTLFIGLIVATTLPLLMRPLRPAPVRIRKPLVILRLTVQVVRDMLQSAVIVAVDILSKRSERIQSAFIEVPLEVRDPNALAALATIICFTPGTAWAELSWDRSVLLVHALDVKDQAELIATLKRRYERPLMEIFE